MKNLITYLKALWGAWGNLQSKDVRHDCRFTVGSPSGLDAKWKQNPFMRFAVVLTLIFTIGSGNAWGASVTIAASDFTGWTTSREAQSQTISGFTIATTDGMRDGGNAHIRLYSGATHTITSSVGNITSIVFTCTANGTNNYGPGKMSGSGYTAGTGKTGTWSGNSATVTLSGGQARVTQMVITYTAAAVPTLTTSSSMTTLTYSGGSPVAQSFTIGGSNLTNTVRVTAPTDYQVSKSSGSGYANYIEFTNTEVNAADKTVYIRLRSGLSAGNIASRNITVTSSGATDKTIAVTGSVPYTITWMANGSTFSTTYVAVGSTLTLPASDPAPATYSCDGKYFYGWYGDASSYSSASVAPSIAAAGAAVSADKTYYAVFADRSGSGEVTWDKVTSAPSNWSGEYVITRGTNAMISDFYSGTSGEFKTASVTLNGTSTQITSTPTDKMIWIVEKNGNNAQYSFKNKSTGTYAEITGTSSTNAALNASAVWFTISGSSGSWKINSVTNSARCFAYYADRTSFRTYANSTNYTGDLFKKSGDGYTWSNYATTCCTPLGSINGSVNMSSSTDGTVTVKDWSEVSYASSYTVKLYQKDGESWDLVAGDAGTKTGITNRSTGATFSGLTYGATYKFMVTAIGTGSYCNGPETAVTSINGNSLTNNEFLNKYSIYIDDGTNSDSGWGHHYIESLSSHTGNVTLNSLTADATYKFKLTLGRVIWYSANATMTSSNCTDWTFYSNVSENCGMTTGLGGNYIFAINAGTPTVSVTYPSASQAADKIIYWDASIHGDAWSKLCFRVGTSSNSNARETTKESSNLVPGTDQFYKMLTCDFGSMEAWTIANNTGWTGTNSVYRTDDEGDYTVTKSIAYQDYAVVDPITIIPTTSGSAGGSSENDGCTFYTLTKYDGMLTHNISVGSADHGTVVATYTNTSGTTGQTVAEGANSDLAHRCIVTITATPDAGYTCSSLTVNGAAFTSGSTHILAADATVAATFTAKTYNITLDREGADNGSTSVTMTYNSATHTAITAPTKSGYDFGGWYSGDNGTGSQVMNASGVLQANVDGYTGAGGVWTRTTTPTTLYAKWTPINYTITYHLNDGTNPGGVPTGFTIESAAITLPTPTREGYNFMGWYANEDLSTGGVQTTIAAGSTLNKEYWAKWEIKKYTVTWHVGESTSTTSDVAHFTTFSTLEASAPSHPDNALDACGSTKFIGWVKASGECTEDGKTADWYNTHKFSSSDQITADTHVYAMYAEASGAGSTTDITINTTSFSSLATNNYNSGSEYTSTIGGVSFGGHYITGNQANTPVNPCAAKTYIAMQRNNGTLYNTNALPGRITKIVVNQYSSVGCNIYCGDSRLMASDNTETGQTPSGTIMTAPTTSTTMTWNIDGDYKYFALKAYVGSSGTNYITSVVVTYSTVTYSNYRTGCTVSCSRPTPSAPASVTKTSATISWAAGSTGTPESYEYKVWEDGTDEPVSGTTTTGTSVDLTGLYSGVTYHWKVKADCGDVDGESIWATGTNFTTTAANLTYSVPTGATAVTTPTTTAGNLNSAEVPASCGSCWAFVGWTTAAYAESSSAPATLFPAGIKARVSGDATLYAVYKKTKYRIVGDLASISADEYYVLTFDSVGQTSAMKNAVTETYYTTEEDVVIKTDNTGAYLENPSADATWIFTGTTSAGRFQNVGNNKYIDLSDYDAPPIATSTSDYVNITVQNAASKRFDIESNTTDGNYLLLYNKGWGVDDDHSGYYSCRLFKRAGSSYTTVPDCRTFTVTWDINNGASTSTTDVTKCEGYLSALPSAPADNTLSGCQTNGKFIGWSASKVMPATDTRPEDLFDDADYSPEITGNTTFYAVFAEETTGATAATNKTFTFTSASWGDADGAWTSGSAGNALTSGRGVQITKAKTGANATTKASYNAITKVTVTYCTNANDGAGSIDIKVDGTSYTGSSSVTNSGGTSARTIDFTPPSSALDGNVKITVTCTTSSIYIQSVQIFYTGSTTTYEGYRTACCNDPQLKFLDGEGDPTTEYVIVREDLASSSAEVTIGCDISSLNTTGAITWTSTHRDKNDYASAYTWSSTQPVNLNIDIAKEEITAKETGVWQITISQAAGATTYCPEDATVTVRVKTIDKFIDAVNGNFSGEPQSLEDTGNGILLPTEAMFSTNNGCSTTRRLIGWIKASDLATYASSRRVDMIDDLKTSDPATNKVIAPGTKVQATGVTWYAVWGVEK